MVMLMGQILCYQRESFHPSFKWAVVQATCFSVMEGLEICLRGDALWRVSVSSALVNKCFQMQRVLF